MSNYLLVLLFLVAFVSRAAVAQLAPAVSGDWEIYHLVASNIFANQCVSLSLPESEACTPHWGGNQLPGFPAFIALTWLFTTKAWWPVAILHSGLCAVAISYCSAALDRHLGSRIVALSCGLVLAASPLTIPWARYTLTETLALSATIWIFAELIRSLNEERLRVIPLAVAVSIGIFIRYDTVMMAVPIALIAFHIHPVRQAILKGAILASIVALPLAVWSLRSANLGLGYLPNVYFASSGFAMPKGYLRWGKTWATSQYQAPDWFYPIHKASYSQIKISESAFNNAEEKAKVVELLALAAAYDGKPFPKHIDREFAKLSIARINNAPFRYWIWLPLKRTAINWWNPKNSAGWPVATNTTTYETQPPKLVELALKNPLSAFVKIMTSIYRCLLGVLAIAAAIWLIGHRTFLEAPIVWAAASYAVARSLFMGWGFFMESRYLLEAIPLLEIAIVIAVLAWHREKRAPTRMLLKPGSPLT